MRVDLRDDFLLFGRLWNTMITKMGCHTEGLLERAAFTMGSLHQALRGHLLVPAVLHRARLTAALRQAAVDGYAIDPWHLAALIENLPLRFHGEDRGGIFDAARHAFAHYQWLVAPSEMQEREIQEASSAILRASQGTATLTGIARGMHAWLNAGHARSPMRAAIIRRLGATLLPYPVPLSGASALRAGTPWQYDEWAPLFLDALAQEADEVLLQLRQLERLWLQARQIVGEGRRRNSRALAALDLLAASPLISATTLANHLSMAPKNALVLLAQFVELGVVVEVTHRSARRLFGLKHLAPLAEEVALPRRAKRRVNRSVKTEDTYPDEPKAEGTIPFHLRQWNPDYTDLEAAMAAADRAVHKTSRRLGAMPVKVKMDGSS